MNEVIIDKGLDWMNCVGGTTDRAAAMAVNCSGLVARIQSVAHNAVSYHCFIHRQALAAKDFGEDSMKC
jgi:hypothetical protein